MKEKEKEATQEKTPVVATSPENATPVENIEVVGAEEVKTETAKPEDNTNQDDEAKSRVIGVKVVTDEEVETEALEATVLEPLSFIAESGETHQITVPKFRFKGQEYDSQKAIDETPEVLEALIEAEAFFIKKA